MDVQALLARAARQREHWAELEDGKRVQFRRPVEVELPRLVGGVQIEHVIEYACGWEGFTEADLLGPAVGSADPLPFHRDLFAAIVRDNVAMVAPVAEAMAKAVTEYLQAKAATEKN